VVAEERVVADADADAVMRYELEEDVEREGDLEPGSGSGLAHDRGVSALCEGNLGVVEVWRLF